VSNVCLYQAASKAAFKLQTIYSLLAASIPIAVAEPPTDTQQDSWVAIRWPQAVCAAVAWDTAIRATPAALVQWGHRDTCRIAACRFVGKFQMNTLGNTVGLFLFMMSSVADNFPRPSVHRPIRYQVLLAGK
jgi:hypothetical protein